VAELRSRTGGARMATVLFVVKATIAVDQESAYVQVFP
jgi:hypothetical protein